VCEGGVDREGVGVGLRWCGGRRRGMRCAALEAQVWRMTLSLVSAQFASHIALRPCVNVCRSVLQWGLQLQCDDVRRGG